MWLLPRVTPYCVVNNCWVFDLFTYTHDISQPTNYPSDSSLSKWLWFCQRDVPSESETGCTPYQFCLTYLNVSPALQQAAVCEAAFTLGYCEKRERSLSCLLGDITYTSVWKLHSVNILVCIWIGHTVRLYSLECTCFKHRLFNKCDSRNYSQREWKIVTMTWYTLLCIFCFFMLHFSTFYRQILHAFHCYSYKLVLHQNINF